MWFYALFTSAVDGGEGLDSRYGRELPVADFSVYTEEWSGLTTEPV